MKMLEQVMIHPVSRRQMLMTSACGFGYLAFASMAAAQQAEQDKYESPLAPKNPHFAAKAKRVIFLFMQGAPSHVDTFDYKPQLIVDDGKAGQRGNLLAPQWKFKQHGKSGLWVSDLFPSVAKHADELCLINSMHGDSPAHPQASVQLHTGNSQFVRPSIGSWVVYGLGSQNQNLPGFITINPPSGVGGAQLYGAAFLPAAFEGTRVGGSASTAISNIANPRYSPQQQRRQIDLVQQMNKDTLRRSGGENPQIEGLIESYELGFRMQSAVPTVMDISKESPKTLEMYGIGAGSPSNNFGRQCLMARRLAEAGVRFIEIAHTGWDQHNQLQERHSSNAAAVDQPIAGLIQDLKQRKMLDDTLIVWGGEFGRTPTAQNRDGRDHNNRGYTMWLAGGGVKGGIRHGATDEHGYRAVDKKVHVHDLHATILHLLGLDHERLTYKYAGRDFRLTDVHGNVVKEIIA
jgi:hypothetical protein